MRCSLLCLAFVCFLAACQMACPTLIDEIVSTYHVSERTGVVLDISYCILFVFNIHWDTVCEAAQFRTLGLLGVCYE